MSTEETEHEPFVLPTSIRLYADAEAVMLVAATPKDDGSWTIEVVDPNGDADVLHMSQDDFDMIEVIDPRRDASGGFVDDASPSLDELLAEFGVHAPEAEVSTADETSTRRRRWPLVLAVVGGLLVGAGGGFVGGYLVGSDGDQPTSVPTPGIAPTVFDVFDAPLGDLDGRVVPGTNGVTWDVVSGSFAVAAGGVVTGQPSGDPAIAVLSEAGRINSFAVSFEEVGADSGLIFRYRDPNNYWELIASPDFGTWLVNRVTDGETTRVATTGFSGGRYVEVVFIGATIQVWVEGTLEIDVRDAALADQTTVGLKISSRGANATIDDVTANGR